MWTPYTQPTGTITNALDRLREHIAHVPERVKALPESELTQQTPGKWSRKEILGHLIDSAINNLKRFTDVQTQTADGPYRIQGYDQDKLVAINRYHALPLPHLLALWGSLNTQIVYVAEAVPAETLARPVEFGQTDNDDPGLTLGWLIEDYVAHLEHHLRTLL